MHEARARTAGPAGRPPGRDGHVLESVCGFRRTRGATSSESPARLLVGIGHLDRGLRYMPSPVVGPPARTQSRRERTIETPEIAAEMCGNERSRPARTCLWGGIRDAMNGSPA